MPYICDAFYLCIMKKVMELWSEKFKGCTISLSI